MSSDAPLQKKKYYVQLIQHKYDIVWLLYSWRILACHALAFSSLMLDTEVTRMLSIKTVDTF